MIRHFKLPVTIIDPDDANAAPQQCELKIVVEGGDEADCRALFAGAWAGISGFQYGILTDVE